METHCSCQSSNSDFQPSGNVLIWLFVAPAKIRDGFVLPLPGSARFSRVLRSLISWAFFGCFLVAFGFDVVDLSTGGYMPGEYGKANPLIALISYCTSQTDYLAALIALGFLLKQRAAILMSADSLEKLVQRHPDVTKSMRRSLWRNRIYAALLVLMASICAVSKHFYYSIEFPGEHNQQPYARLMASSMTINVTLPVASFVAILVNYSVKALFVYFTSFLHCYTTEFCRVNAALLMALKAEPSRFSEVVYVERLRHLRHQSEQIYASFDCLQQTFNGKLLCDVVVNFVALCVNIGSISIWSLHPVIEWPSMLNLTQNIFETGTKLFCVAAVFGPAIALYKQVRDSVFIITKSNCMAAIATSCSSYSYPYPYPYACPSSSLPPQPLPLPSSSPFGVTKENNFQFQWRSTKKQS